MKKTIALLMVMMMLVIPAGCGSKDKLSEKEVAGILSEELDAEKEDAEDIIEALKEMDLEFFEDGVWSSFDRKQTKRFYQRFELRRYLGSVSDCKSSICYARGEGLKTRRTVIVMVLTFENEKDAETFVDDTSDTWDDEKALYPENDSSDEKDEFMAWGCDYDCDVYIGAYKSGNKVVAVIDVNAEDLLEEVCDAFGLTDPVTLREG